MKYFQVIQNTDLKIIGKYPQVKNLRIDFHKAKASQWGKISEWKSEKDIPNLNNFLLESEAKLTDCISNSFVKVSSGIIISQKCEQVFGKFIVNGNFYEAVIYKSGKKNSYSFLWYEYSAKSKIDCKASVFIEYNRLDKVYGEIIPIEDFEDFKIKFRKVFDLKGRSWDIIPKVLKFKEYFDMTPAFDIGLICNENVKKAIEENQLTGFDFRPIDVEIVFE